MELVYVFTLDQVVGGSISVWLVSRARSSVITFILGGGVIQEMSAAQMLYVDIALASFLIALIVELVGARVYLVHGL